MHHADIRAALTKRGLSLKGFDKLNGFAVGATHDCLHNPRPEVERALSKFLELSLHALFPDRYLEDGTRIILRGRPSWDPKCDTTPSKRGRATSKVKRVF